MGVNTVLKRNKYIDAFSVGVNLTPTGVELTPDDPSSVDVNLTSTDGKKYATRVYHPIGFQLIVMESQQPKAKQFKVGIAQFVWQYIGGNGLTSEERLKWKRHFIATLAKLEKTKDDFVRALLITDLLDTCRMLGLPLPSLAAFPQSRPAQMMLEFGWEKSA